MPSPTICMRTKPRLRKQLKQASDSLAQLKQRQDQEEQAVADARKAEQSRARRVGARTTPRASTRRSSLRARAAAVAVSSARRRRAAVTPGRSSCTARGCARCKARCRSPTLGARRAAAVAPQGNRHVLAARHSGRGRRPRLGVLPGRRLGGNAAYVNGGDGNTYYMAHLNDYVGGGRRVRRAKLIGHVGNTGDASGGPTHLHFEIRPGGPNGAQIDPYPTLAAHC